MNNENMLEKMCEGSENYLWHLGDRAGSGATSDVYKAYHVSTGEIVAAKVSKFKSVQRIIRPRNPTDVERKSDPQSVFDQEIKFLKDITHDNIVRFIGTDVVTMASDAYAIPNREVLFLEFCNAGSIGDILRLPANRYGLPESCVVQIMNDVTSALKYLHERKILHRDIKPDNIMQSIDINGKTTYKLTDLGVARKVKPEESTTYSIPGTEEYVHPRVYCEAFPEIKINQKGQPRRTRIQFPFEVEMWSFGVTIYQCSTGRIPFQPLEGTRNDRNTMRQILTSIPPGCISGVQLTHNGEIQWSEVLPNWCRLSLNLKSMLEKLLSRLFETNHDQLMQYEEFFTEVDRILCLIPIHYLNLKTLTLTCTYFQADDLINCLFDQIQRENGDEANVDYYCLFQNVYYPVSRTEHLSIKQFYERLPVQPSRDKPLVIYTFSSLKLDQKCTPKVHIPEIQPMKNVQDRFLSNYDWSKNITGLFFYLKSQLIEYEYIMKITQSSITTINRFLKSKLLKLLSAIRNDIFNYQSIHELDRISTIIDSITISNQSSAMIRPILRAGTNLYQKLMEYDKALTGISEQNFNEHSRTNADRSSVFNTIDLFKQINNYSMHIQRSDKYTNDAIDLCEKFRRDTLITRSTSLQMTSHILREKLLQQVHDQFIHLVNGDCYPLILEIFNEYKNWIKQQGDINQDLERIRLSYEEQCRNRISVDRLRRIVKGEIEQLKTTDGSSLMFQNSYEVISSQQLTNVIADDFSSSSSSRSFENYSTKMQETIKQAEENAKMLKDTIRQLHQQTESRTTK